MADTVITILIVMSLAGTAALGVYVSFVPLSPDDKERPFIKKRATWVSAAFCALTMFVVILSGVQTYRGGKQQEKLGGDLNDLRKDSSAKLEASLASQEFMKGQLNGLSLTFGALMAAKGQPDEGARNAAFAKIIAKAIHDISLGQPPPVSQQPPAPVMGTSFVYLVVGSGGQGNFQKKGTSPLYGVEVSVRRFPIGFGDGPNGRHLKLGHVGVTQKLGLGDFPVGTSASGVLSDGNGISGINGVILSVDFSSQNGTWDQVIWMRPTSGSSNWQIYTRVKRSDGVVVFDETAGLPKEYLDLF